MYAERPLREYLDDLAQRKPAPGGGSAAALEAALGCALISMVANFTISNKKYENVKEKAAQCLEMSEKLRKELLELVDRDVKAYTGLAEGFKRLGKDSPELDKLYKVSCDVPVKICRFAKEGMDLCKGLVEYGNRNLITDTAIAAVMLEGAFLSAKLNVFINLKYIKDGSYNKDVRSAISGLEEDIPKLKEEILRVTHEVLNK